MPVVPPPPPKEVVRKLRDAVITLVLVSVTAIVTTWTNNMLEVPKVPTDTTLNTKQDAERAKEICSVLDTQQQHDQKSVYGSLVVSAYVQACPRKLTKLQCAKIARDNFERSLDNPPRDERPERHRSTSERVADELIADVWDRGVQ